jgi:ATP-dependent DNA helicase RecG
LLLGLCIKKLQDKEEESGISYKLNGRLIQKFKQSLPFELTNAQKKVIRQIENDLTKPKAMNRLLQGDVGSGKTVVATYALVLTVDNGYQGAIMAPTELLAEQHYLTLSKFLNPLGIKIVLLISGFDKKKQNVIYNEMELGAAQIIIGTHALIQEKANFRNLGLVVIDEQHKFGVMQRATLGEKGLNPHILVMTATPIPRSLALTIYGNLDISTIDELPPGRRAVKTILAEENKRADIYKFIKRQIEQGRQAYIVYPLIEESYKTDLRAATSMYERLKKEDFAQFKIGLVHGRLKKEIRDKVMNEFKEGKIDILVSTMVIEVGIDIPNATVMLIENAERFGLSQLHQLRGRIGRGSYESYAILLPQEQSEEAKRRLLAMVETQDGFKIAEQDLLIRGPGEFFGTRQHGLPELRVGHIVSDLKILELAKEEVNNLLAKDPQLTDPKYFLIKENLKKRFRIEELKLAKVS